MNPLSKLYRRMRNATRTLSPSCREAARLQSEALDHEISIWSRLGLRFHLLLCKWCRRYGKQIAFLHSAARQLPEHEPDPLPPALSTEARDRIRRRLKSEMK